MKSVFFKTVFLLFIFLSVSCDNKNEYKNSSVFAFEDFGEPVLLTSELIDFDAPIMLPGRILLVDSILLVENRKTKNLLYRYNIITRKKVGECIPFGSGPDELLRIKHMQKMDSSIYVSDNQKRVVFKYNLYDLCYAPEPKPLKFITINEATSSLACIPQGYVCTTMNPRKERLSFFNLEGDSIGSIGDYPVFGNEMNELEKINAYVTQVAVAPSEQLIYLFYMQTDLIEIYDCAGQLRKRIHGPEQFFPHVKEQNLQGGFSKVSPVYGESREAYYNPMVVNNEIYVFYSGAFYERKPAPLTTILVFDLNGRPLRRYHLSEPIIAFTVDPVTKDIYATSDDPEYHIIRFKK